jgi:NADH:ubiquinone oxidoreductase subunit 6 (subunit J)
MIRVIKPLKTSQSLKEEAAQSMLKNPAPAWKPRAKSTWATPAPEPPKVEELKPTPIAETVLADPPESAIHLAIPHNSSQFVTGSDLAVTKMPLPKGIYVIVALGVIDLVLSLFRSSDNSVIFTIIMFFDLLACVGLLLKLEFVRKMLVVVAAVAIVLIGFEVMGLLTLQDKVNQQKVRYAQVIHSVDTTRLTTRQRTFLAQQKDRLTQLEKRESHAMTVAIVGLGVSAATSFAQIIYLTRPKVRAVFEELKT